MTLDVTPEQSVDGSGATFLRPGDITREFTAAWRDLATRAAEASPFAEPDLVLPAMAHPAARTRVGLLAVTRGDRLEAVLPVTWPLMVSVARNAGEPGSAAALLPGGGRAAARRGLIPVLLPRRRSAEPDHERVQGHAQRGAQRVEDDVPQRGLPVGEHQLDHLDAERSRRAEQPGQHSGQSR